ncbi:MAG: sulfotransferase [Actinobacteria bacterium]|nr:sulfotransferase [Actinomycetota bacterium]
MGLRKVVSNLNKRMPSGIGVFARKALLGWGMVTADLRMVPDFIVIGAQRAGTTTLFRVLSEHPEVVRATVSKGVFYFDLNYSKGMRWYRGHFPLRFLANLGVRGRARTFESSGYYLFHPLAAERMARDLPNVKVVAMLRDPVERAYSAHRHELMRGFETEDFETALALEPERTTGADERIRQRPDQEDFDHRHHSYVARGQYAPQLQRYVDQMGPDRVFVVDADRFFGDPEEELAALFSWLGLAPWLPPEVAQWNAQAREPMDPELRERLTLQFADSDEALEQIMGRTPSWVEARRGSAPQPAADD